MSTARVRRNRVYVCGGQYHHLDPRESCPNTLHDWPLPLGYGDAHAVAAARLSAGWGNPQCPDCRLYGWAPSSRRPESTNAVRVEAPAP